MGPLTSLTTQQAMVVQSMHHTILYLASMEPATLLATQQYMVELFVLMLPVP